MPPGRPRPAHTRRYRRVERFAQSSWCRTPQTGRELHPPRRSGDGWNVGTTIIARTARLAGNVPKLRKLAPQAAKKRSLQRLLLRTADLPAFSRSRLPDVPPRARRPRATGHRPAGTPRPRWGPRAGRGAALGGPPGLGLPGRVARSRHQAAAPARYRHDPALSRPFLLYLTGSPQWRGPRNAEPFR